jgi:uncharacterized RDD family membrane protein YckC
MTETFATHERAVTAGLASRAAAMIVDVVVIAATFYGGLALAALTVQVLRFHHLDATAVPAPVASIMLAGWTALYFWAGWWTVGKTVGKAILGLRVVRQGGGPVSWSRSLARVGGYVVSIVAIGLGFIWVAVDRRRRGWHDILAGTRVVYDWHPHGVPVRDADPEPDAEITPRRYEITP